MLGESLAWRTDLSREVRHKSLQVAQKRVQTVLNRLAPEDEGDAMGAELPEALDKVGL